MAVCHCRKSGSATPNFLIQLGILETLFLQPYCFQVQISYCSNFRNVKMKGYL